MGALGDLTARLFGPGEAGGQDNNIFSQMASNPAVNFGMGLMKASQPKFMGDRSGRGVSGAFDYAAQRDSELLRNDWTRSRIEANKAEADRMSAFSQYLRTNPDALGDMTPIQQLLMMMYPEQAARSIFDPNAQALARGTDLSNVGKETANLEATRAYQLKKTNSLGDWDNISSLTSALEYLKATPGGAAALQHPDALALATKGLTGPAYVRELTKFLASTLSDATPETVKQIAAAAATVNKAHANLSVGSSQAVAQSARQERGMGQGSPVAVQLDIAYGMQKRAKLYLEGNDWLKDVKERTRKHPWEEQATAPALAPQRSFGTNATPQQSFGIDANGQRVPQPDPVVTPFPPAVARAAPQAAAPQGQVPVPKGVYADMASIKAAFQRKELKWGDTIIFNGETMQLVPADK